jgi:tetratricopeptide (TPR) repeat protein
MKKLSLIFTAILILTLFSGCKSAGDKLAADGAKAFGEGRYADALKLFSDAETAGLRDYKDYELNLMIAGSYYGIGDYQNALLYAERVIVENDLSGQYDAYNLKALCEKALGEYDTALMSFQTALTFNHTAAEAVILNNNLANLLISMNNPTLAIDYLNQALALDNTFADTYGNLAIAYAILFDFDSAESALADAETMGYTKVAEVQSIIEKYRNWGSELPNVTTEVE